MAFFVVAVKPVFDVSVRVCDVDNAVLVRDIKSLCSGRDRAFLIAYNKLLPVHYRITGNESGLVFLYEGWNVSLRHFQTSSAISPLMPVIS